MTRWMELEELKQTYSFVKKYAEESKVLDWIVDNGYFNKLNIVDYNNYLLKLNDSMSLAGVMLCYLYEYSPYKRNILFAPRTVGKDVMAMNIAAYHIAVKKKYIHIITSHSTCTTLLYNNINSILYKIISNKEECTKLIQTHISNGLNLKDRIEEIKANDKDFSENDLLVFIEDYAHIPEKLTYDNSLTIDSLLWENKAMTIPEVQILGWGTFGNIQNNKRAAKLYRHIFANYNDSIHFSYMKHHLYTDDNLNSPLISSMKTKADTMYLHVSPYEIFGYKNEQYCNEMKHLLVDTKMYCTELCLNWNEV